MFGYRLFRWNWEIITESIINKGNVSWNSTVGPMNSAKKCSIAYE